MKRKENITIKDIIQHIKYKTSLYNIRNIIQIFNILKNKKDIFKIIDIINKNNIINTSKTINEYEKDKFINEKSLNLLFEKIINIIDKNNSNYTNYTIQFPNEKMLSINNENFNYFDDLDNLYDFLEESIINYDLYLNPIIIVKKIYLNIEYKNKKVFKYLSYIVTPNKIIKQIGEETKEMLLDFISEEEMNEIYIFE